MSMCVCVCVLCDWAKVETFWKGALSSLAFVVGLCVSDVLVSQRFNS